MSNLMATRQVDGYWAARSDNTSGLRRVVMTLYPCFKRYLVKRQLKPDEAPVTEGDSTSGNIIVYINNLLNQTLDSAIL